MDRLSPRLELRGEWRQAAAITAPAAAAELVEVLDRALDLLEANRQLDEASLTMAVEVVCRAFKGRTEEVELLRHRLRRAVRDFAVATAGAGLDDGVTSEAFSNEEALASALFGMGAAGGLEAVAEPAAPAAPARPAIDERALHKSLAGKSRRRRRALLNLLPLLLVLIAVGAAVAYFLAHPPQIVVQQGGPTAAAGLHKTCTYQASVSGQVAFTLTWLPAADSLTLDIVDPAGKTVATSTRAGGSLTLQTPALPGAVYSLRITGSGAGGGPTQFQLALGGAGAPVRTGTLQPGGATCPDGVAS
jgi:hypothetical protein